MTDNKKNKPRIALVADMLLTVTGSEQVFSYMVKAFPDADIYTLAYNESSSLPEFRNCKIKQHWLHRLFSTPKWFKLLFVPATFVMQNWYIGDYDIVLISSASTSKYLKKKNGRHICYCYIPTRALWQEEKYFEGKKLGFVLTVFKLLLPWMKKRDVAASKNIDHFVSISETSRRAVKDIYGREAEVLFSPVPLERFRPAVNEEKKDFFLLVSRLEKWKRLDHAVEAFTRLGLPLLVVGEGEEEAHLKSFAGKNVTFLGKQPIEELVRLYGQARAVINPSATEYGLVPIESAAAGTPCISLGYGGALETMIGVEEAAKSGQRPTVVFYPEQTADSLMDAVRQFETISFDRQALIEYTNKFSVQTFQKRLQEIVAKVYTGS